MILILFSFNFPLILFEYFRRLKPAATFQSFYLIIVAVVSGKYINLLPPDYQFILNT